MATSASSTARTAADVVIIGGGPGGYVAAIRAAQLGLNTVCVEMDKTLGGTCVNVGCIPSKALLASSEHYEFAQHAAAAHGIKLGGVELDLPTMLKRKDDVVGQNTKGIEFLFRKNKITWAKGKGTLKAGNVVEVSDGTSYQAKNVIIATGLGSDRAALSEVRRRARPLERRRAQDPEGAEAPHRDRRRRDRARARLRVEAPRRQGHRGRAAAGDSAGHGRRVVKEADKTLAQAGTRHPHRHASVTNGGRTDTGVFVEVEKDGKTERIEGDHVLVSVGRKAATSRHRRQPRSDSTSSKRGVILVDDQMRTNLPNVYAIGDCVPGPMLAHKAEEEGVVAAEVIAGHKVHMHYKSIPGVVYTWPEIASVGLTEKQVKESGREYRAGKFPFSANGRARSMGDTTGFVKFIADAKTDELLGAHMIGPNVSELIAEVVLAFEYRGSSEDIAVTVHAHPTLSEVTKEAALATLGRALHI